MKHCISSGAGKSSSTHADNGKKYILIWFNSVPQYDNAVKNMSFTAKVLK